MNINIYIKRYALEENKKLVILKAASGLAHDKKMKLLQVKGKITNA